MQLIEVTYSGDLYHDYWAVVAKDGELFAARCDSGSQAEAEAEAKKDIQPPYKLEALARVGHTAYNQVGPGHINNVASAVLEAAAPLLGIRFAEAPKDAPLQPDKWIGEEWDDEAEDRSIARSEQSLEWACEQGLIPGAL